MADTKKIERKRYQVISAVTWRLVSDLLRRHHTRYDLRVLEIHPGRKRSDRISVFLATDEFPGTPLCHFSKSGALRAAVPDAKVISRKENYVDAFLATRDPWLLADHVETVVGLSPFKAHTLPGTTRPILMLRLIAGVLERFMTSREAVEARCGWLETLDSTESHMRDDLMLFPHVGAAVRERLAAGESKAQATSPYWLIYAKPEPGEPAKLFALFDPGGKIYYAEAPEVPWDAYHDFKKAGRKLLSLVNVFEEKLRKAK